MLHVASRSDSPAIELWGPQAGPLKKKHVGAVSELLACTWLLRHGYEVFRNVSPFGEIDLVAIKDGVTEYFDIKTGRNPRSVAWKHLTRAQIAKGVKSLIVLADGNCVLGKIAPPLQGRECPECGRKFQPHNEKQLYCRKSCGSVAYGRTYKRKSRAEAVS